MPKLVLNIAVLLMAVLVIGCGSGSSTSGSSEATLQPFRIPIPGGSAPIRYEKDLKLHPSGLAGAEPRPVLPKSPPPEFLAVTDLIKGIGELATPGSKETVQYVAYDYESGKKLASSWEQGKPVSFTLGRGEVIEGWEEGIDGMEIGDRRELVVPADLANGPYPRDLPQDKDLVFVVETLPKSSASKAEAVSAQKSKSQEARSPEKGNAAKKTKPVVKVPNGSPPKKLEIRDLEEGSGPAAKLGDEVT